MVECGTGTSGPVDSGAVQWNAQAPMLNGQITNTADRNAMDRHCLFCILAFRILIDY